MTPLQFAKAECSNYTASGSCLGVGIKDDGSLYSFGAKPRCVLTDKAARCKFFEECVLPMGIEPSTNANIQRAKARDQAIRLYQAGHSNVTQKGPLCPECRKRVVEPPKRFCYDCAERRAKASKAVSQRKKRKGESHEEKTPSKTLDSIGSNDGHQDFPV